MQSIGKFSDVIFDVKRNTYYVETLEDGTVITDETRELPTINFKTTTKLHGTFSGIIWNGSEIFAESKSQIITPENDNDGFAKFVEANKEYFEFYLKDYCEQMDITEIMIAGEWAGGNIQKGTAINKIPKTFFMFGLKFKTKDEDIYKWAQMPWEILRQIADTDMNIQSLYEFDVHDVAVDFNKPAEALKIFDDLRDEIDKECPVGKALGVSGVGEGLVAVGYNNDVRYVFKHKGESHVTTRKQKQPKPADPLEASKQKLAEALTPVWRLEQAVRESIEDQPRMKDMSNVIKWVMNDIKKEETSTFRDSEFELEDVQKFVSVIIVSWFKDYINEEAMRF